MQIKDKPNENMATLCRHTYIFLQINALSACEMMEIHYTPNETKLNFMK